MKSVIIDGVPYAPSTSGTARFGVAMSTHKRRKMLARTLPKVLESLPPETPVVLTCDDAQTYRDAVEDWAGQVAAILQTKPGVYASKNAGLEYFMTRTRVEHLFLLDDDVHPAPGVDPWTPYIEAPEPHYAHSWGLPIIHRDRTVVATTRSGGTVLYATRQLIEAVGGMSGEFGTWGHEHWNWSDRAHNQGLTSNRYQDLPQACDGELWIEFDRPGNEPPNFDGGTKTPAQVAENKAKWPEWERLRGSDTRFVEYRRETPLKHVVAAYYRSTDPQTGKPFPGFGRDQLRPLAASVSRAEYRLHILSNAVDTLTHPAKGGGKPLPGSVEFHEAELVDGVPTDWQRWFHLRALLADLRRELGGLRGVEVWHVDATDVTMINPPMVEGGRLYCGWEPTTVNCKWVARQVREMPDAVAAQFSSLEDQTLLNPGVLGGDAEQLARFVNVTCSELVEAAYWGKPARIRDNVVFQLAAARWEWEGNPPLVTGPRVATVFKSGGEFGGESAWWQHK